MNKQIYQILGIALIIIALILGIAQHYEAYNFYGDAANKWYFYSLVAIIGIIGIIAIAWTYLKKQPSPTPK